MKLQVVLDQHQRHSNPDSVMNNLGDGFLINHNPIFSAIRRSAIKCKFSYSNEFNPAYQALPMSQLESILQTKKIPFTDNVAPLVALNEGAPNHIQWNHVVDNLKPNYIFHESFHAVARTLRPPELIKSKILLEESQQNLLITCMLIEESFANTSEFLAIAYAQDVTHRLFLEMNSFFTIFEDRNQLKKAIDTHSFKSIAKFMFLCYLQSNFLKDSINTENFRQIIEMASFNKIPDQKLLKSLAQNAFALNPRFRFTTTELYLRLHGIHEPVQKALNFEPLEIIKKDRRISGWIDNMLNELVIH